MAIGTKNIYDPASPEDALRLLVMRKWPRGVSRQQQLLAALLGLTAKG